MQWLLRSGGVLAILLAGQAAVWAQAGPQALPTELPPEPAFGNGSTFPLQTAPLDEAPLPFGGPLLERPTLTGDWCGYRTQLQDCGITLDVSTTQFFQGVASGGLERCVSLRREK